MFKLVCSLSNGPFKKGLKRLRLYHPPLHRLLDLSDGTVESLVNRSKEFSELLDDILINGVWKRTGVGRLSALDEWVGAVLPEPLPISFDILDVGGSDGSTTFNTVCYFRDILGLDVKATILEMQLRLHYFRYGCIRYYLTHDRSPLFVQFGLLGVLFEETKAKEGFLLNPIIRLMKKCFQQLTFDKFLHDCGEILLESPLVRNSSDIVWLEQDLLLFDPKLTETFNFIRCCNVLNCGYFSDRQIHDAIQLFALYLKPKGLLLVSRTIEDSTGLMHTASLWMKIGADLQHVSDLNGGSEVKKLVPVIQNV